MRKSQSRKIKPRTGMAYSPIYGALSEMMKEVITRAMGLSAK